MELVNEHRERHGLNRCLEAVGLAKHNPIALHALKPEAYAVVEKLIATTIKQFVDVRSLIADGQDRLFACFYKRYSSMNTFTREDLG